MRAVPEWRGASDDAAIPPRVQLRIFNKYGGHCACGCGRKICPGEPWNPDHILALCNGGQNRESNLHPLLLEHHKVKTRKDLKIKTRIYKAQLRHVGVKERRQPSFQTNRNGTHKRHMDGTVSRRAANETCVTKSNRENENAT